MQLSELRTMVEARGVELVGEYVDRGVSGSKDRRPELDRLMREARRRQRAIRFGFPLRAHGPGRANPDGPCSPAPVRRDCSRWFPGHQPLNP